MPCITLFRDATAEKVVVPKEERANSGSRHSLCSSFVSSCFIHLNIGASITIHIIIYIYIVIYIYIYIYFFLGGGGGGQGILV